MFIRNLIYKFSKTNKYDHIISLGYNCEISYQFYCNYKFTQSHIFSWVEILKDEDLLAALTDLNGVFSQGMGVTRSPFVCKKYDIYFHNRKHKKALYNEDGSINEEVVIPDQEELLSRVSYLREKFKKTISSDASKLFIVKPRSGTDNIKKLKNILDNMVKGYNLLIVTDENKYDEFKVLESDTVFVRKVLKYSPDKSVTDKKQGDMKGWKKIFKEFGPSKLQKEKKTYKFEDID